GRDRPAGGHRPPGGQPLLKTLMMLPLFSRLRLPTQPFIRGTASGLVFLSALALLSGCGEKAAAPAAGGGGGGGKRGGGGAAPVLVGTVQKKTVPLVIEAIGAVEPMRSTVVRSQVTGTLVKIAIQEGQTVKEGDLIFSIDPRPFENALRSQAPAGVLLDPRPHQWPHRQHPRARRRPRPPQ
ncbi:MAG: biotin/lipoyl-binding protein, partial [Verrucomicrobia bacterium]|nr:biotin/lipoyl-binding protein [Verrucomicrobiota bacterium]